MNIKLSLAVESTISKEETERSKVTRFPRARSEHGPHPSHKFILYQHAL